MNSLANILEDFSDQTGRSEIEGVDLPGYDDGYNAGWEDATNAHQKTQDQLKSELSEALQENAFTFHEARSHVLKALKPLMVQIVQTVLPELVVNQSGGLIVDTLMRHLANQVPDSLVLTVAPNDRRNIELLLPTDLPLPVTIREDASLLSGQSQFSFDDSEFEFDLPEILSSISRLVDDYFAQIPQQEAVNG